MIILEMGGAEENETSLESFNTSASVTVSVSLCSCERPEVRHGILYDYDKNRQCTMPLVYRMMRTRVFPPIRPETEQLAMVDGPNITFRDVRIERTEDEYR